LPRPNGKAVNNEAVNNDKTNVELVGNSNIEITKKPLKKGKGAALTSPSTSNETT
jgi:hypothetical protein